MRGSVKCSVLRQVLCAFLLMAAHAPAFRASPVRFPPARRFMSNVSTRLLPPNVTKDVLEAFGADAVSGFIMDFGMT